MVDLILAQGNAKGALTRGQYMLGLAESYTKLGGPILDLGLCHLLIGRALDELGNAEAAALVNAAVGGLRKSGFHKPHSPSSPRSRRAPAPPRCLRRDEPDRRHPRRPRRGGGHRGRRDAALSHGPRAGSAPASPSTFPPPTTAPKPPAPKPRPRPPRPPPSSPAPATTAATANSPSFNARLAAPA